VQRIIDLKGLEPSWFKSFQIEDKSHQQANAIGGILFLIRHIKFLIKFSRYEPTGLANRPFLFFILASFFKFMQAKVSPTFIWRGREG